MFTERRSSPPTPGGMGRGDVGGVGGLASVRIHCIWASHFRLEVNGQRVLRSTPRPGAVPAP